MAGLALLALGARADGASPRPTARWQKTGAVLDKLEASVRAARQAGFVPEVVWDIDRTLLSPAARENEAARRAARQLQLDGVQSKAALRSGNPPVAEKHVRFKVYAARFFGDLELLGRDRVYPGARQAFDRLRRAGALNVILTARAEDDGRTARQLVEKKLTPDAIIMGDYDFTSGPAWKAAQVAARNQGRHVVVGVLDDDLANVRAIAPVAPGSTIVWIRRGRQQGAVPAGVTPIDGLKTRP